MQSKGVGLQEVLKLPPSGRRKRSFQPARCDGPPAIVRRVWCHWRARFGRFADEVGSVKQRGPYFRALRRFLELFQLPGQFREPFDFDIQIVISEH